VDSGVSKFDGTTWTTYSTANGLLDNAINTIAIDTLGNKWFGTNNGVSELNEGNLGINPVTTENHLILYPNPVQNVLQVNFSGKTGTLEAYEITGKSVLQKEIARNNNSIDVSGLDKGIYLVKVLLDKQCFTGKFVKQ